LPQVASPEPDRTSDSVRQRRLNWFCYLNVGDLVDEEGAYVAGFVVFEIAYGEFFVQVIVVLLRDFVVPR